MSRKPVSRKFSFGFRSVRALALSACLLTVSLALAQTSEQSPNAAEVIGPIPFRQAVSLALQNSGVMGIATVNQWRSFKAYQEVRNHYLPQLTIGSGLGYSYGFPLTL